MYMREMGTVELLTREGENRLPNESKKAWAMSWRRSSCILAPSNTFWTVTKSVAAEEGGRLSDIVTGFLDPLAEEAIMVMMSTAKFWRMTTSQPQNPAPPAPKKVTTRKAKRVMTQTLTTKVTAALIRNRQSTLRRTGSGLQRGRGTDCEARPRAQETQEAFATLGEIFAVQAVQQTVRQHR